MVRMIVIGKKASGYYSYDRALLTDILEIHTSERDLNKRTIEKKLDDVRPVMGLYYVPGYTIE